MFNNKDILCIDIGSRNIKFVSGKYRNKTIFIDKATMIDTPINSFNDGNLADIKTIKEAISREIENQYKNSKMVSFTSYGTSIITREIVIPSADEKDLNALVRFEIEQYLPIVLDDYIIDYSILERFNEENVNKLKLMVIAYPKHMAENYLGLAGELNLKPFALDINSNCISKLLKDRSKLNDTDYLPENTLAIIDMGHTHLNVDIISKGINNFSRIVNIGGKNIDTSIAKRLGLSLEAAELKKINECDLTMNLNIEANEENVNSIIKNIVDVWIQEINRILQYYRNKSQGNRIDSIYLHGGSSKLKGIEEYMSMNLGLPVYKIKTLENIQPLKDNAGIELSYYLNVLGTIIRL